MSNISMFEVHGPERGGESLSVKALAHNYQARKEAEGALRMLFRAGLHVPCRIPNESEVEVTSVIVRRVRDAPDGLEQVEIEIRPTEGQTVEQAVAFARSEIAKEFGEQPYPDDLNEAQLESEEFAFPDPRRTSDGKLRDPCGVKGCQNYGEITPCQHNVEAIETRTTCDRCGPSGACFCLFDKLA